MPLRLLPAGLAPLWPGPRLRWPLLSRALLSGPRVPRPRLPGPRLSRPRLPWPLLSRLLLFWVLLSRPLRARILWCHRVPSPVQVRALPAAPARTKEGAGKVRRCAQPIVPASAGLAFRHAERP